MKTYKKQNIVFVEYNGVGRPFQVYTDDLNGFDFFYKNGYIQCSSSSWNIRPFLNELTDEWKNKKKLKVWFNEQFRPYNNSVENKYILKNEKITEMGYVILSEPKYLDEIINALNDM